MVKRNLFAAAYTIVVAFAVGRWAVCMAYLERGYRAVGGEYLLVLAVCRMAWKAVNYLFDTLENSKYE